jgi:hypothetical protein
MECAKQGDSAVMGGQCRNVAFESPWSQNNPEPHPDGKRQISWLRAVLSPVWPVLSYVPKRNEYETNRQLLGPFLSPHRGAHNIPR